MVVDYVKAAQPVGSRTIARRHLVGLSPATIRNEMVDLMRWATLLAAYLRRKNSSRKDIARRG